MKIFMDHLKEIIKSPIDRGAFITYVMQCMNEPKRKAETCIALCGECGTGKTLLASMIDNAVTIKFQDLKLNTSLLSNRTLVVEEFTSGDVTHFKSLISSNTVVLNLKHRNSHPFHCNANFLILSNDCLESDHRIHSIKLSKYEQIEDFANYISKNKDSIVESLKQSIPPLNVIW